MIKENKPILDEFNVTKWHDKGLTGRNVTIAVLDNDSRVLSFMKDYCIDVLGTGKKHSHATNIGQVLHEFAFGAKILLFDNKFYKDEAFNYIKEHKNEIDLINVSQAGIAGMPTPEFLRYEALNIPMICASGNDGYNDHISYPACYDWTIAIGAWNTREKGMRARDVALYSNGGVNLDAVAPTGIYVQNEEGYVFNVDGTSFATPSATGMLACYIQWRKDNKLPKLKPEQARKFIHDNCIDIREEGFDYASGHGLFKLPETIPQVPTVKPTPPVAQIPIPSKPQNPIKEEEILMAVLKGSSGTLKNAFLKYLEEAAKKGTIQDKWAKQFKDGKLSIDDAFLLYVYIKEELNKK